MERIMKKKLIFLLILAISSSYFVLASQDYSYSNFLPKVIKEPGNVMIRTKTLKEDSDIYIYYRTTGVKKFQVRKMEVDEKGNVYFNLPTGNLYGKDVEYFILEGGQKKSITPIFTINNITEKESPEIYFQEVGSEQSAPPKKRDPLIKVGSSLSSRGRLHDTAEPPGEEFDANGNIRLYRNVYDEDFQFDFDTNFSYMNNVSEDESKLNLSNMKVRFKKGVHTMEVGDLSINSTEFSTSYLSRRGLFYEMNGKTLYLSSFFTNSQQKTGFDGFGFPPTDANIFGASAGINIKDKGKIRGLFMAGKDNVSSKTLYTSDDAYREGSLISIWGEVSLLKRRLQLNGEYSHCNFGKGEDQETLEKESDSAWRAGFNYNHGIVNAQADYKKVGGKFNSIANLFLENDWEGLAGNVGLNIKSLSINLRYTDRKTNLTKEFQPMLHTKNLSSDLGWMINNHFRLGAEFGLDNLDYDQSTGLQTGSTDMSTVRYSGSLGYIAGSNGLTLRVGKTESKTFTSNLDASLAGNLRLGNFFTCNPTFSYQSTENLTDDSSSKIYNLFLNSEITFVPELFSFTITGSWTKNDNTFLDTTMLSLGGNFNIYLAKLFKQKVQPVISFRGKYEKYETGDTSDDSVSIYLHADFSF
jgi:hypothetical protein